LTGLRPSTSGIYGLAPWFRNVPALASRVSLPQHLAAQGYTPTQRARFFTAATAVKRPTRNSMCWVRQLELAHDQRRNW
jgi:hypothetical protein